MSKEGVECESTEDKRAGKESQKHSQRDSATHPFCCSSLSQNTGQPRLTLQPFSVLPFRQFLLLLFLVF